MYYMRPFTDNKGLGKLSDDFVPRSHAATHEKLKNDRNTLFAHSASQRDCDGVDINRVCVLVESGGVTLKDTYLSPSPGLLDQVEQLLDIVTRSVSDQIEASLAEHARSWGKHSPGLYQVSCEHDREFFLVRVQDHER